MTPPRRNTQKSHDTDTRANFIRGIEHIGDSLIIAAAKFANAKASVHVGDWPRAEEQLRDGFAECAVDKSGSDGIFARLAELKRQSKGKRRKSGLRVTKKGSVPRA